MLDSIALPPVGGKRRKRIRAEMAPVSLSTETRPGAIALTVGDLERCRDFYERVVGLHAVEGEGPLRLGANGRAIIELHSSPGAAAGEPGRTGLFHVAILVSARTELARAAKRIVGASWSLTGVADHLVSEALYLDDPEGNGLEIYRDRPRSEWRYEAGALQMATLPLDLEALISTAPGDPGAALDSRASVGHVHLKVAELDSAEAFYADVLGFDVMVRGFKRALFLSAGGYHHHIGLNTWLSAGGSPPPPGSRGLRSFEIVLASTSELDLLAGRIADHGLEARRQADQLHLTDPSGNALVVRVGGPLAG